YEFEHGIVIVATGAEEHKTEEYLYSKSKRIITQVEFEEMLNSQNFPAGRLKNVVMIQCVGSREQDRMYCSRVCCNQAIKNSIALKRIRQNTDIYMLYRDIRTYGLREKYYTQARDNGVIFLRYDLTRKPEVVLIEEENPESKLRIRTYDPILDKEIEIEADLLVLSVAMDPPEKNSNLAKMLKVPLNQDGFFLEAHVKLRPVDFATDGIFVCGLAHGPKDLDESIVQAKASAGRALTFLSKKAILAEGTIAQVNPDRCSGCGYCEEICAYAAIEVDPKEEVAVVNDALCKGCGACAASCRCGAIDLRGFSDEQLFSAFNTLKLAAID
ncbi:MAG: CoB--CoM heterodisulfide reductase iron-sulfur subunit A family protein, partial [Candidatus Cloacimonetes bacterium]|nr:CoB--CoM heterodisulfide reductase iron-sulfur subunit A family protein [Candidatus Cloacimonadota bacterium]